MCDFGWLVFRINTYITNRLKSNSFQNCFSVYSHVVITNNKLSNSCASKLL